MLHLKKKCLIKPEGVTPKDWPAGWEFPPRGAMPPGWPRKPIPGAWRLAVSSDPDRCSAINVCARCLDQFGEDTDMLMGELVQVSASCNGDLVRLRDNKRAPWSLCALVAISDLPHGGWGIDRDFYFNASPGSQIRVNCSVFGYDSVGYSMDIGAKDAEASGIALGPSAVS